MSLNEIRNKTPSGITMSAIIVNPIAVCDHKQRKENNMKSFRCLTTISRAGIGAMLMFLALAVTPHHAWANTASNTAIINTATVNYKDATGTVSQTPVTASATVTVTLVAAAPTLSAPADQNTTVGVAANYSYTITSNANGPDSYALSTAANGGSVTNSANITASTAVPAPTPIILGATTLVTPITIPAATNTALVVPSDGVADASVNGIVAGDTVVINSLVYSVISVVDNASGTSTITVNGPASAALTYGALIAEQKTFTLAVTPTAMNPTTTNETVTVVVSAKGSGAAATDTTVTTVPAAALTVTKEVSLTGLAGSFAATANAAPGTSLFYRITVSNTGASNATSVVITDPLTAYTTYTAGSGRVVIGAAAAYGGTVLTDTIAAADGYDWNETTVGSVTYAVGTIAPGAGNNVQLFFKATVN